MVEQAVFWVVQSFIGGLLLVIAYFLKRYEKSIDEALKQHKQETDTLRQEIYRMQSALPQSYVFREDYIRTMADFNRKLDRLLEHNGGRG